MNEEESIQQTKIYELQNQKSDMKIAKSKTNRSDLNSKRNGFMNFNSKQRVKIHVRSAVNNDIRIQNDQPPRSDSCIVF